MTDPLGLFRPQRIVSGGQTGVDRGALEAAIAMKIPHGGWCPRGRLAEDGTIPDHYELTEHRSASYKERTLQNVLDSDATLILFEDRIQGGTRLTQRYALEAGRPLLLLEIAGDRSCEDFQDWLREHLPTTLNIAGPRESNSPGIQERSTSLLLEFFGHKV